MSRSSTIWPVFMSRLSSSAQGTKVLAQMKSLKSLLLFAILLVSFGTASAQQGPSTASKFHFRQHAFTAAPHRPMPARVPESKRHHLPTSKAGSVIGGIWMTDANFKSTLTLRNLVATTAITVTPTIYLSNGRKILLTNVKLDPDGVVVINLNDELAKHGVSSFATLSGYVEVQYNWPWLPVCATVRALDPVHSLLFYYGLQPSLHVRRPKFRPGQSPILPAPATVAAQTVEGVWWKQEANVTGFLGLVNTTPQPLTATVNVTDQQSNSITQQAVTISPHGMKLVNLPELSYAPGNSGGITINYTGLRDDLVVNGALQDPAVGYSAMLPFMFMGGELPDQTQMTVAELGLMVGAADPMLKFPAGTTFTPYSVLRNISDAPITANPTLWWMANGTPQYADIPAITLGPHQSQLLNMTSILASAGLTNFTGTVNLVFDAPAKPGTLLFSGGSVDKANTYVFAIAPRGVQEGASKSLSYWSTGNGNDTMVTLWNPADEPQDFVFQVNYPGGHYDLPIELGARATRMFNMSEIIATQVPDDEGNIIPANVQEGSAVVMGSQGKPQQILLAVDAATYNVKKATCGTYCWVCDGYDGYIDLYLFGVGNNGGQTQEDFYGIWDDNQWETDFTSDGQWSSSNNSIMTVSAGRVTGHGLGKTDIWGLESTAPVYDPNTCSDWATSCDQEGVEGGAQGTVFQFLVQGNPYIFVGTDSNIVSANVYFATNGSGGAPQPAGGTCCAASSDLSDTVEVGTGQPITINFTTLDQSTAVGDRTLTFEYNLSDGEGASQQMNVTARKFAYVANDNPPNQCTLAYGTARTYTYTVYTEPDKAAVDQNSGLSGTPVEETFNPAPACHNVTGNGALDPNGQFQDNVGSACSSQPLTCTQTVTQSLSVAGNPVRTNTLTWSNTGVTYTSNGPTQ